MGIPSAEISISSLYMFFWCIWKARNDARFCRKISAPSQVYAAATAIMQGSSMEVQIPLGWTIQTALQSPGCLSLMTLLCKDSKDRAMSTNIHHPGREELSTDISTISGPIIYLDAAWPPSPVRQTRSCWLRYFHTVRS